MTPVSAVVRAELPEDASVAALVDRARGGDAVAFGELFDRFHNPVYRLLLARTGSRVLAEDLTSETFFEAMRVIGSYALPSRLFGAWLRRIALGLVSEHDHARVTRIEVVTEDPRTHDGVLHDVVVPGPEDAMFGGLDHDTLRAAMLRLSDSQRRTIALRFLLELSIAETAAAMGCTEGAVKQLQWRGLRGLAVHLRDESRR